MATPRAPPSVSSVDTDAAFLSDSDADCESELLSGSSVVYGDFSGKVLAPKRGGGQRECVSAATLRTFAPFTGLVLISVALTSALFFSIFAFCPGRLPSPREAPPVATPGPETRETGAGSALLTALFGEGKADKELFAFTAKDLALAAISSAASLAVCGSSYWCCCRDPAPAPAVDHSKEVLIAGAGPVGLATALLLAEQAQPGQLERITVWEKARFEREMLTRPNVLLLEKAWVEEIPGLEEKLLPLANGITVPPPLMTGAQGWTATSRPGDRLLTGALSHYSIPINRLQKVLLELCAEPRHQGLIRIEYNKDSQKLLAEHDVSGYKFVVGTEGATSPVATRIGNNQQAAASVGGHGLVVNVPCFAGYSWGRRSSDALKAKLPQHRWRLFQQSPTAARETRFGAGASRCEEFSYYLGVNLSDEEARAVQEEASAPGGPGTPVARVRHLPRELQESVAALLAVNGINVPASAVEDARATVFPVHLWRNASLAGQFYSGPHKALGNAFIAGDATMGAHFFSGTGVNTGMKQALALARVVKRQQLTAGPENFFAAARTYNREAGQLVEASLARSRGVVLQEQEGTRGKEAFEANARWCQRVAAAPHGEERRAAWAKVSLGWRKAGRGVPLAVFENDWKAERQVYEMCIASHGRVEL